MILESVLLNYVELSIVMESQIGIELQGLLRICASQGYRRVSVQTEFHI